jgi:putative transposase
VIYHVLNRANARIRIFGDSGDYEAFEETLSEARARTPVAILAYCLMPNHWHLVLRPEEGRDKDLSRFVQWLSTTHAGRWHANHGSVGLGHLYQGRFKSFPVQEDSHFLTLCRYVERNPVRANLVRRAEEWRWSSLGRRLSGTQEGCRLLAEWPVERPSDWTGYVNEPQTEAEQEALRQSMARGRPLGDENWTWGMTERLSLRTALRPRGRPCHRNKGV